MHKSAAKVQKLEQEKNELQKKCIVNFNWSVFLIKKNPFF